MVQKISLRMPYVTTKSMTYNVTSARHVVNALASMSVLTG